ncbi:glucosamine-phosphate N-acetyltransferase domain protein [Dictyocaulus viviparus]|uniref:Glucosamine 6-phosphate N-acetyltransferase n=1 Tax=Dictyocaulus viviparus TaxID=29172 RepID=A0A0D8X9N6_DICVI|nr:glucosamine-phosphate N-acetyltransferase domain protein [Dictyocaulus viviparus]
MPMLPPVVNIGRNDECSEYIFDPLLLSEDVVGEVPKGYVVRPLMVQDYENGLVEKLIKYYCFFSIVSTCSSLSLYRFKIMRETIPQSYYVVVVEDSSNHRVVGTATLVIEWKFIHHAGCRGRVEDLVVDESARGKKMGFMLNRILVTLAKQVGVYKLSLECKDSLIPFYERHGYKKDSRNHFLVQRFDSNL